MRRREFIAGFGGAVAWPFAARAQRAALPVIGYLGTGTARSTGIDLDGFRQGLAERPDPISPVERGRADDYSQCVSLRGARKDRAPCCSQCHIATVPSTYGGFRSYGSIACMFVIMGAFARLEDVQERADGAVEAGDGACGKLAQYALNLL